MDACTLVASYKLTIQDMNNRQHHYNLTSGTIMLHSTVVTDVKHRSLTDTISTYNRSIFKQLNDNQPGELVIYEYGDTKLIIRLRLMIAPEMQMNIELLENAATGVDQTNKFGTKDPQCETGAC